ncbi:MAG: pilin [Candidatus Saccharimonadales bacterium]
MNSKLITCCLLVVVILFGTLSAPVFATTKEEACKGVQLTGGNCQDPANQTRTESLVQNIVNVLSVFVGIVATIMIMVGGFKYITSQGDSGNISGAKNTILYAIVGLVVVAFAQIIVRFVISKI